MRAGAGVSAADGAGGVAGSIGAARPSAVTNPRAIMLLGWIGAIKATGATVGTVSLVEAAQGMGLSASMRSAAASAVSLAIAATAVAAGVAADRFGRRRILMWSFVLTAAADLAVFLFPTGIVYVVGLTVSGVGFGAMITGSYAYVKAVAPGKSLGLGLGLFGMFTTIVTLVTSLGGGALAVRGLALGVPHRPRHVPREPGGNASPSAADAARRLGPARPHGPRAPGRRHGALHLRRGTGHRTPP